MFLDIIVIDVVSPDGVLTSYKISPRNPFDRVLLDRYRDIHPKSFSDELDIGGVRLYNSEECSIRQTQTRLRSFELGVNEFTFQFEHMGIPIGPSNEAHGGLYNLILPPGFRLTNLYIVDPYDKKVEIIQQKKQFQYNVYWDNECKIQLVEMHLTSRRGSFSFICGGSSVIETIHDDGNYVESTESTNIVNRLSGHYMIPKEGKDILTNDLVNRLNWIELKPNIFGIGLNINEIINSCLKIFKKKTSSDDS